MRVLTHFLLASVMTAPMTISPAQAAPADATIAYPRTEAQPLVEEQFGVKVADPYRWLENDVREDARVRDWVTAQNKVTDAYLATLPARATFARRLTELFNYERVSPPVKRGGRYFYARNDGLQNQAVLNVRDRVDGPARVLIDPNGWAKDGATALAEWRPSDDGRYLVYAVQDGGTDWRTVRVLDVETGKDLPDSVEWVKFSNLDWAKDGSGFFYSRFPQPASGGKFQALNENQQVYFHRLGTPQSEDRLVYRTPDRPRLNHIAEVSDDGKWLIITSSEGTDDRYEITLVDLSRPDAQPRTLIKGLEHSWNYVGNQGSRFLWTTNKGAPRLKIVALDIAEANPVARDIVPEDKATLGGASVIGGVLIASYLVDAKTEVRRYRPDGTLIGKVALPGIGTAAGFGGKADDPETFFAFTSFATPTTVFRYDARSDTAQVWAQPRLTFKPEDFKVEQRFFASKDGTQVPMFIVRRKDVTGPAPTLMYGYGGFNISNTPAFSAGRLAWIEQGGAFALVNLRGGGEYGKAWHDAGRLLNKQNVFDDFIAAGEYLIREGVTGKGQLAIQGGSNGGLLVGAVTNQRPDLFAAALPAVGVMDMLRFDRFTAGRYWVDDYGYPSKEADFRNLLTYSPYHNVRSGTDYPAVLVTTADTDDRVVPGHSFKYVSALQAAAIGPRPHLIRIETRAGHGAGKPTDKIIAETADQWAFIARWTGLTVR
ncbi:prolyl oligopeptidase family serine peptidase [Sphingomonas changnyeongensis]|uniref:prolyl oligopeptidase n=2 Tax=Sphingomonas changnyeongensis TaxID=2698679 RepID=A0A7Z2NWD6_9SPHN|nr:prolyl oligopeptidase family serine peptidase [Sphingomonas changnyeongensis]